MSGNGTTVNGVRGELQSWIKFAVMLIGLMLTLATGSAAVYARLCVLEAKVDILKEEVVSLRNKVESMADGNKTASR